MQLDHVNIKTPDAERSVAFYRDVLGLRVGERPGFSFPGVWLYSEDQPLVHLNVVERDADPAAGAFDHIAFYTTDLDAVVARIEAREIPHRLTRLPDGTRRQCFLRDPDGVLIEIAGP